MVLLSDKEAVEVVVGKNKREAVVSAGKSVVECVVVKGTLLAVPDCNGHSHYGRAK